MTEQRYASGVNAEHQWPTSRTEAETIEMIRAGYLGDKSHWFGQWLDSLLAEARSAGHAEGYMSRTQDEELAAEEKPPTPIEQPRDAEDMCPNCVTPWKCNGIHIADYERRRAACFWERVDKSGDCWLWTGTQTAGGYGRLSFHHLDFRAHRLSWEIHHGRSPDGVVRHDCDTPLCVRPDHLRLGSHADNVADRHARGRDARGERVTATSKLTEGRVREIRALHDSGTPKRELAERSGVTRRSVSHIVNRDTWKHLPND